MSASFGGYSSSAMRTPWLSALVMLVRTSTRRTFRLPGGGRVTWMRVHDASVSTARATTSSSTETVTSIGRSSLGSKVVETGMSNEPASAGTKKDACDVDHR